MAFPTTSVLDGGTSPVENPISTNNWTGPIISGQQPLQRTATGIARGSAVGGSYINTTYGPDVEGYATINVLTAGTNTDDGLLFARYGPAGTATPDGYVCYVSARATASTDRLRIGRDDNAVTTVLGTYVIGTIAVGDKYGISCVGDQITGWYCPVSTGIWSAVIGPVTDATYSASGILGINMARSDTRLTDFGGGEVITTTTPPELSMDLLPKRVMLGIP